MKKILIPIDGTKRQTELLEYAVDMAKRDEARILALSAINVSYSTGVNWKEIYEIIKAKKVEPALAEVVKRCEDEEVPVETLILRGTMTDAILKASKEEGVDMVILSMEQHKPGSTVKGDIVSILSRICCPVLTVKKCKV